LPVLLVGFEPIEHPATAALINAKAIEIRRIV